MYRFVWSSLCIVCDDSTLADGRCGESVDRGLLKSLMRMLVDLQVRKPLARLCRMVGEEELS